jgi:hypothetical protein
MLRPGMYTYIHVITYMFVYLFRSCLKMYIQVHGHAHIPRATIVTVYDYCSTWRLVSYVWCGNSSPPRPLHEDHDVAWQSLNMDLFKAEVSSKASLGGAEVAALSIKTEEQPAI